LLVAAAESTGDRALVWRAAEQLGTAGRVLEPAVGAGLLEVDTRVRFRHPLVRSAVYQAASPEQRRRVHRALTEATDALADPDRRAWHLANATAGPDEKVAGELEHAADRAKTRGGLAAAGAFLERASRLTLEPSRRADRALAAADAKYRAGLLDDAQARLDVIEGAALDDLGRARVELLRAESAFVSRRSDAAPMLLRAARGFETVDVRLARYTYLAALAAALFAVTVTPGAGVVEVSEAVLAGPVVSGPRRAADLLLDGLAIRFTQGYAAGAPTLKEALNGFRNDSTLLWAEARSLWLAGWVAADLWDDETWVRLPTRALELARNAGALTAVLLVLGTLCPLHAAAGDLDVAASLLDELVVVSEATGIPTPRYGALWLSAVRGREGEVLELTGASVSRSESAGGDEKALALTESARAVVYNGLGRYHDALAAVRQAGQRDEMWSPREVAELIEAAARCGEFELAGRALGWLAETTQASATDWALGVEARSRALLSDGEMAESLYQQAIERLQRTRQRLELGRAHLLYGEWLRRDRRRVDARQQLRIAHDMLTAIGAQAFAERAERELIATGEHVRKRAVDTRDELTPQEARIASLAGDGLSNPEIGARLFISKHTVEYHLRKVFTKLGINSRLQLERALAPDSDRAARL
jgi:DNA-binding CsgD family transcriptional regulator